MTKHYIVKTQFYILNVDIYQLSTTAVKSKLKKEHQATQTEIFQNGSWKKFQDSALYCLPTFTVNFLLNSHWIHKAKFRKIICCTQSSTSKILNALIQNSKFHLGPKSFTRDFFFLSNNSKITTICSECNCYLGRQYNVLLHKSYAERSRSKGK